VEDIKVKKCTVCNEEKPISSYRSRGGNQSHLLKSRCNTCLYKEHRKWTEDNKDKVYEYRKKDTWTLAKRCARRGISPMELVEKYEEQNNSCAICKLNVELSESAIDHNHETGEFRGVLCKQCNRALGMFKDNSVILKNAIDYLEKFGSYGTASCK
jgi:hypothetical protein